MEATTVKTEFGKIINNYPSKAEFIAALEAEYHIGQIDGSYVFSIRDRDFIVLDWYEFCDKKPNQKNSYFSNRECQKKTEREYLKLPIVNAN